MGYVNNFSDICYPDIFASDCKQFHGQCVRHRRLCRLINTKINKGLNYPGLRFNSTTTHILAVVNLENG